MHRREDLTNLRIIYCKTAASPGSYSISISISRELMPPMHRANESYLPCKSKQGKCRRVDGVSAVTMTAERDDDRNEESA